MDKLKLVSTWSSEELGSGSLTCVVEGLLLQGCNFDGRRLNDASKDDLPFVPVPKCHLAWMGTVRYFKTPFLSVGSV